MVKIRIMGDLKKVEEAVQRLEEVFQVMKVSEPYLNRNNEMVRVYVEVSAEQQNWEE